jgi:DNA-binding Lrp family transcriptional regulator
MATSGAGRVLGVKPFDGLDDLDRRIIVALQRDGRASWTAIAEMCNSSVPTVTRRGQQLLADGVVRVAVVPQLGSTGPVESFFIRINCQPGMQLAVANELVSHENVRFLTLVTGTYDLMAELVVSGGAASFPHLIQELQSITGIERWRSDLILHVYKVGHATAPAKSRARRTSHSVNRRHARQNISMRAISRSSPRCARTAG